ncbi:hypothetical protein D3C75_705650 [compost metagenome]
MSNTSRDTVLCRYHYDPLDRQNGCTVLQQPAIQRFHCKSRLTTEIQGAARWSILQHDDQLLAQQSRLDAKVGTTLLATDQQRSILNALDATQPNPLAYTPYGHRPAENGLLSLLGFNGERPDPVTGHYHLGNGYRQFNPVLMRFNSPDSWSPFGEGGLNAYAYCLGDPINRIEVEGHASSLLRSFWKGLKNLTGMRTPSKYRVTKLPPAPTDVKKSIPQTIAKESPPSDTFANVTGSKFYEPNELTPTELNSKLNTRYRNQPHKATNPPHKGKHFPPKPSPSIHDGVNPESYKKFATFDQLHKDYIDNKAILDALENQPSTSKPLKNFTLTQDAINVRFAQ